MQLAACMNIEDDQKETLVQVSATLDLKLGGPTSVVTGLSQYLSNNFELHLLVFGNVEVELPEVIKISTLFGNRFGLITNFRQRDANANLSEADILIIHGYYLFSTLYALWRANTNRLFLMPHGSLEPYQDKKSKFAKKIFRIIFKVLSSKKNIVFLVGSSSEKENIVKKFPSCHVEVVGLGISDEILESSNTKGNIASPINLLCFSRITEKKRIDLCIRALANLNQKEIRYILTIAGAGEPKLTKELQDLAVLLGVENETHFLGFVHTKSRTRELFLDSDLLLLPSENENFAVAVAEAIGFGVPVVVSKFVAMHEFVDKYSTGVTLDQLSSEDLSSSVRQATTDFSLLVSNCFKYRYLLSWSEVSKKWIEALSRREYDENE
jgi:glycosyltransferase involved in cell wall biosynthesis